MGRNLVERAKIMAFTLDEWHARYLEQAQWTASLRAFLFRQIFLPNQANVLETGSGTGAILSDGLWSEGMKHFGIDVSLDRCTFAREKCFQAGFACADGISLPFANATFDLTFCHYYLLWMNQSALPALEEMVRVTRPGGYVLAMAEPDYAARIDYPAEMIQLGNLQNTALTRQGAALEMGRRLPGLFQQAGLTEIQFGQSGFQREVKASPNWLDSEWSMIIEDLGSDLPHEEIKHYEKLDRQFWQEGSRVLQIPTFYAFGRVKTPQERVKIS
jgi:SAM-dependent methyltransferase